MQLATPEWPAGLPFPSPSLPLHKPDDVSACSWVGGGERAGGGGGGMEPPWLVDPDKSPTKTHIHKLRGVAERLFFPSFRQEPGEREPLCCVDPGCIAAGRDTRLLSLQCPRPGCQERDPKFLPPSAPNQAAVFYKARLAVGTETALSLSIRLCSGVGSEAVTNLDQVQLKEWGWSSAWTEHRNSASG